MDYDIHPILPENQKDQREAQVISLINTFISKNQIKKEKISISIPREKVVVRFIKLPITTKENLRKVVEYEAPKYTPFEKGEIYFDYCILKEEKDLIHLFLVFVKKDEINQYLSLLKKIRVQPISIQIPTTAALNLFFYNGGGKEENSALIDMGDSFFEMNLLQGKDFIETIHLPLPSEGKEKKIINTFKRSPLKRDPISKSFFFVYGLGTDEETLTTLKETEQVNGLFFPPLNRIEGGKGSTYKIYASMGVSLNGLTKTQVDLNLLPLEMRKKVRQIGKPLFMILASLAFALSLAWGVGVYTRHKNELNMVNAEIKKRKPAVEVIERLQKQKEAIGKEISEFEKIKSEDLGKIEILRELTQLLPSSVWIWNLKFSGKEIEISGFADSASDLIPLLDKSPLLEKVAFSAPVTKERIASMAMGGSMEKERFKIKAMMEIRRPGS